MFNAGDLQRPWLQGDRVVLSVFEPDVVGNWPMLVTQLAQDNLEILHMTYFNSF